MESFKKWAKLNGVFDNSTILGIPQDNPEITPKEKCRYDVCVVINKDFTVAKPDYIGEFSGGKYAVFLLNLTIEAVSEF
jgi:DNA gyrase inhibitor GyrI